MRRAVLVIFVLGSAMAAPGAAEAAIVELSATAGPASEEYVSYSAGRGERNRLLVTRRGRTVFFSDPGARRLRARKTAFGRCRSRGRRRASCPLIDAHNVTVALRDGNDSVRFKGYGRDSSATPPATDPTKLADVFEDTEGAIPETTIVTAGAGNDTVRTTPSADVVSLGPGRDRVLALGGDDDVHVEADGMPDDVDGGGGVDTLDYTGATPVTVDLAAGTGGAAGASGPVRATERVHGGDGDDVVTGGDAAEGLFGDLGADLVNGGGGNDWVAGDPLWGEGQADRLDGGAGDDILDGRDGKPGPLKSLSCGDGADRVLSLPDSALDATCEQAAYFTAIGSFGLVSERLDVLMPVRPVDRAPGGHPVFDVPCPGPRDGSPAGNTGFTQCDGTLAIENPADGQPLGSAAFSIPPGGRAPVTVTMSPAGLLALAQNAQLTVRITRPGISGRPDPPIAAFGWQAQLG